MKKAIPALLVVLSLVAMARAQTKISGTEQCGGTQHQSMDVGDRPNHFFMIDQGKCTWTKPVEIEGVKTKDDAFTTFSETTGNRFREQGYVITTMESGDKCTVRLQFAATLNGGKLTSEHGTWSFVSGTGKLKGIKGKGTSTGKVEGDNVTIEVEGEYTLPAK